MTAWSYAPLTEHGLDVASTTEPLQTTYYPAARTVVVTGARLSDRSGTLSIPSDVSVDGDGLTVQFDRLDWDDAPAVPTGNSTRPFALSVHFESALPRHTKVVYADGEDETAGGWQNPSTVPADD